MADIDRTIGKPARLADAAYSGGLEDHICEASNFADMAACFIGAGLDFQRNEAPTITAREAELLFYAVGKTSELINKARDAFYAMEAAHG